MLCEDFKLLTAAKPPFRRTLTAARSECGDISLDIFDHVYFFGVIKVYNKSTNETPAYATEFSAGVDLRAYISEPITLNPLERKLVPTGLYVELQSDCEAQIRPRSGLALKHGITVLNSPGTIDADYRGEICVVLINLSNEPFVINNGERIAQMVVSKYEKCSVLEVDSFDELSNTERGEGGFGHSGKQ